MLIPLIDPCETRPSPARFNPSMLLPVTTAPGVRAIPLILSAAGFTSPSASPLMSPPGFFSEGLHSVKLIPLISSSSLSLQLIRMPLMRGAFPKLIPVLPMVRLRAFEPDDSSSCANAGRTAIRRRRKEQIVFMITPLDSEKTKADKGIGFLYVDKGMQFHIRMDGSYCFASQSSGFCFSRS